MTGMNKFQESSDLFVTQKQIHPDPASGGNQETKHKMLKCKEPGCLNSRIKQSNSLPYWRLFEYADKYDMVLMFLGTLAALVSGMIFPTILVVQSRLINSFGSQQNTISLLASKVSEDATYLVYTSIIALVASYFEVSCWMRAGERQTAKIRVEYLRAILRQNIGYFDSEISSSEVVSNVSIDTLLVQDAISEKVGNFIENISHFVGGYMVAFTQIWKLAVIMLPFTPLLILPGAFYSTALSDIAIRREKAYAEAGSISEQAISSIRTIYSFVAEKRILHAYSKALDATIKLGLKQGIVKGVAMGSSGINFALWAFMAWYGSVLVIHGHANGGQILATGFAVISGGMALGSATPNLKVFSEGCVAGYRIFHVIERIPPIDSDTDNGVSLEKIEGNIHFRNVSFSYPSRCDAAILQHFNLKIPAGKVTAIVGSSGCGKSTVIALLERFYDPLEGEVLLDGVNLKNLKLGWLRKQIGLVSQEPALFSTSIKENILYGKEDATMDEIIMAAKAANAHGFITKLPAGYDTQVGENGVQMSGGEKQRIAIARALIRNPCILLLDEATSALDSFSEQLVQQALETAYVGRTTIIIAHRLSTIRNADTIAVLHSGKVVEVGGHDELMAKAGNGHYATYVQLQQASQGSITSDEKAVDAEMTHITTEIKSSSPKYHVLTFQNDIECTESNADDLGKICKPSFMRLLALNGPEWKQGFLGVSAAICFGFVHPFYAFLIGDMVSTFYDTNLHKLRASIKIHALGFFTLGVASFIVNIVQHYTFGVMGESLTKRVRERMLNQILKFEVGWFDKDENNSGAVCSRLGSDASMVRAFVGDRVSLLLQTASAITVSFAIGLITCWRLALIIIATQPLIIACYYIKSISLRGFAQEAAKAQQDASKVASEAVSNHRTITSFSSENKVLNLFQSKLESSTKKTMKRSHIGGLSLGVAQFILYASWGLDFWYGSILVKQGKATFGEVLKTIFVLVSTGRVLAEAGTLTPDLAKSAAAVESVFEILDQKAKIDANDSKAEPLENIKGEIMLENISFAYPARPDVMIFRNFNLKIHAAQSMALVGQSGSGKSSIIGLVERFYDPVSGRVMIDGKDVKTLHLQTLRHQIALVSQEPTLFGCSIWDNIAYGKENATETEVFEAARAANAHNFICSLPNGYSTFAGERGLQLSGGQKQRIAIARAIIKNPAILLLDEATSALDAECEKVVQKTLDGMMVGRTTILVAHRLSTIQNADVITVLEEGNIVEQGTHQELLRTGSVYQSLVSHSRALS